MTAKPKTPRNHSTAGQHAFRAGRQFQLELEAMHQQWLNRASGAVYPHARETVGVHGKLSYKKGGNPVDYSGHLNYRHSPAIGWESWHERSQEHRRRVPVVFDAKSIGEGLSYNHDAEKLHQLLTLMDAHKAGAAAFLRPFWPLVPSVSYTVAEGWNYAKPLVQAFKDTDLFRLTLVQ